MSSVKTSHSLRWLVSRRDLGVLRRRSACSFGACGDRASWPTSFLTCAGAKLGGDRGRVLVTDGRSAYRVATAQGRSDLVELLRRHGARDDATDIDRLLYACRHGDRASAQRALAEHPALLDELSDVEAAAIITAAESSDVSAVRLMLDLGFPVGVRGGDQGETALHAAAYAGSADTVRVLLDCGGNIEARDSRWNSRPLDWALVGSGEQPDTAPAPDWLQTVALLLDAGASTADITLSPDGEKPPDAAVAQLLRDRGIGIGNGVGEPRSGT
jgi:hypothetical protein